MKDINFIKTLSIKQQHGLRKWVMFSLSMMGLVIVAIALLQIPQLNILNQTKKEYRQLTQNINTIHTRLTQKQNLKNKMCCLDGQCKTVNSLACATQAPRTCISCINNACINGITLQTCNLQNNHLALTAECANVQQATHFLQQLQKDSHFSQVQLTSLQPAPGNFVTFTVKGSINI